MISKRILSVPSGSSGGIWDDLGFGQAENVHVRFGMSWRLFEAKECKQMQKICKRSKDGKLRTFGRGRRHFRMFICVELVAFDCIRCSSDTPVPRPAILVSQVLEVLPALASTSFYIILHNFTILY